MEVRRRGITALIFTCVFAGFAFAADTIQYLPKGAITHSLASDSAGNVYAGAR